MCILSAYKILFITIHYNVYLTIISPGCPAPRCCRILCNNSVGEVLPSGMASSESRLEAEVPSLGDHLKRLVSHI